MIRLLGQNSVCFKRLSNLAITLAVTLSFNAVYSHQTFAQETGDPFNDCISLLRKATDSAEGTISWDDSARVRDAIRSIARDRNLPAYEIQTASGHYLPVILINKHTFYHWQLAMENTLGYVIRLQPGSSTDHAMLRWKSELMIHLDGAGLRSRSEIQDTGVLWDSIEGMMSARTAKSRVLMDMAYYVSKPELEDHLVYHSMRRAAIYRTPYLHAPYGHGDWSSWDLDWKHRPQMLQCVDSMEHCFHYVLAEQSPEYIREMKQNLSQLGVADVGSLLHSPEALNFEQKMRARVLSLKNDYGRDDVFHHAMLKTPESLEALKGVMPSGLDENQQIDFINFLFGIQTTERYLQRTWRYGIQRKANYPNIDNNFGVSLFVFDESPEADSQFRNLTYEYSGEEKAVPHLGRRHIH